jgi:hypothetical protein
MSFRDRRAPTVDVFTRVSTRFYRSRLARATHGSRVADETRRSRYEDARLHASAVARPAFHFATRTYQQFPRADLRI